MIKDQGRWYYRYYYYENLYESMAGSSWPCKGVGDGSLVY